MLFILLSHSFFPFIVTPISPRGGPSVSPRGGPAPVSPSPATRTVPEPTPQPREMTYAAPPIGICLILCVQLLRVFFCVKMCVFVCGYEGVCVRLVTDSSSYSQHPHPHPHQRPRQHQLWLRQHRPKRCPRARAATSRVPAVMPPPSARSITLIASPYVSIIYIYIRSMHS